jgi:hypothetical protein
VAGFVAVAIGIAGAVGERDAIESDAVARGRLGEPLRFSTPTAGDYTIFLLFGGRFNTTERQELAVSRTSCTATLPVGRTQMRGSRQGFAITLGSASSLGHFGTGPGDVEVICDGSLGDPIELVISPGRPSIARAVAMIIGGALAVVAGGFLIGWGLIGKRVPV